MLEVLAPALASGQKAQEDARRGQSSIFDLGGDAAAQRPAAGGAAAPAGARARSSTSASCCGWRRRRWAPSSRRIRSAEVRDALRERVDCTLADVAGKADGAWVTVGGIVSEAKKVRTRSGGYVMFATLDDLEGQVELFVRDAAGEPAEAIELDRVILVRGRVDHKGRGETSLVVAEAEPFEPGEDELAAARAKAAARDPEQDRAPRRRRGVRPPASSTS